MPVKRTYGRFWVNNLETWCTPKGITVWVNTDTEIGLALRYSLWPPISEPIYRTLRGTRAWCGLRWRLKDFIEIEQEEPHPSFDHTFKISNHKGCQEVFFYLLVSKLWYKQRSGTPIMAVHCPPITCWTENFPGPGFELPWVNTSSPGLPPPIPENGTLTLYAPVGPWRHEILLMARDLPSWPAPDIENLYLSISAQQSSVGGKRAQTYARITYENPETGWGTYRTIYFAHETQDCTGFDPLYWDPGIGAWRAPNTFSAKNLSDLYYNPPDFCWPVNMIPMKNLLSIRLGAAASGWGDAKLILTSLQLCHINPTPTHPRYEPRPITEPAPP